MLFRSVFLKLSCFFDDPANVGNLISGSYAFSKTSLNIWKFTVHLLLKPGLQKELPLAQGQGWRPRVPGCNGTRAAKRSYPRSEVWGSGREEIPHARGQGRWREKQPHIQGAAAVRVKEGREELLHVQGQEGRP